MRVLLEELSTVEHAMPPIARKAIKTSRAYWFAASRNDDDLLTAKEECWALLDTKLEGAELGPTGERLTRAVLCTLEPEGDEEAADMTAEWFAAMLG